MNSMAWSQNMINDLLEVVKTGIILTDNQGEMRFSNRFAAELLGYPRDSLTGESLGIFFLPEDTRILLPNILKLTRENTGFEGEVLLCKRDGSSFFVNLSSALYQEESTGYEFIIFTLQDITHFKKMEKEHLDSERFIGLGMITDQISHQIRNPVASIGGFALRLAKDRISQEEYHQYSQIIHNEARRLEHIIDRLVEFARVQPARYGAFTLSEIFEGIGKAFKMDLEGNPSCLTLPVLETQETIPLYGDPGLLIRAVQCVVRNGLEASSQKEDAVTVSGEIVDNRVQIHVKDKGEGILPEHLPFIFDPFFTTKFNYLGLGLTMAKRIVQVHKGRINVDSASDKGTDVCINLPKDRRREIRTRLLRKKSFNL